MLKKVNLLEAVNQGKIYEYIEIGKLNNNMLNVLQVEKRTLDFHVHEESDELFYVIEGKFFLELEDEKIEISTGEFVIVPKGVRHRPICDALVKILLIDLAGALNDENCRGSYTNKNAK